MSGEARTGWFRARAPRVEDLRRGVCRKCDYPDAPFKHHDRWCPNQPEGEWSVADYLADQCVNYGFMLPPGGYRTAEDIFDWMWRQIVERAEGPRT